MVDLSRRNFFKAKSIQVKPAIRLPYVLDEITFIEKCTQCSDCITACPENIIEKGEGGFPEINFTKGECTFCNKCVDVCKAPLFKTIDTESAFELDIAIKDSCLAANQVHCQVCQDSCEAEAISFIYLHSSVPQPQISLESCNGCGACVAICPQLSIELSPQKNQTTHTTQTKKVIGETHECS